MYTYKNISPQISCIVNSFINVKIPVICSCHINCHAIILLQFLLTILCNLQSQILLNKSIVRCSAVVPAMAWIQNNNQIVRFACNCSSASSAFRHSANLLFRCLNCFLDICRRRFNFACLHIHNGHFQVLSCDSLRTFFGYLAIARIFFINTKHRLYAYICKMYCLLCPVLGIDKICQFIYTGCCFIKAVCEKE